MWINKFQNPESFKAIFRDEIPSLEDIYMHEIKFINGADLFCTIRFNLRNYIDNPPIKWKVNKYNTIQITITFLAVSFEYFKASGNNMIGNLIIEDNLIKFQSIDLNMSWQANSQWLYLDNISAYIKEV